MRKEELFSEQKAVVQGEKVSCSVTKGELFSEKKAVVQCEKVSCSVSKGEC